MKLRQGLAYALVRLADRVYNHDHLQRIQIRDGQGKVIVEWSSVMDPYGYGINGQLGQTKFGEYTAVFEEADWKDRSDIPDDEINWVRY